MGVARDLSARANRTRLAGWPVSAHDFADDVSGWLMGLADQQCVPCRGGVPPLPRARIDELLAQLAPGWALNDAGHLLRTYEFREFTDALEFANRVGAIAEQQGHHPDLHVGWGRCGVEIWTHKIGGLTDSDFYLAAKADRAFNEPR